VLKFAIYNTHKIWIYMVSFVTHLSKACHDYGNQIWWFVKITKLYL